MRTNPGDDLFSSKTPDSRPWLFFFIVFVLVLGFSVFYFSQIKKELLLLEKINSYWLAIALVAQFATYFFTALIYHLLLNTYKQLKNPGLWELIKASVISLFFNQTMPSAGISGNTFFLSFLSKLNVSVSQSMAVILAELLIFYAAMEFVIFSLLLSCLFFYTAPHTFSVTLAAGLAVYLVFGILIALTSRGHALEILFNKIQKIKFLKKLLVRVIHRFQQQVTLEKASTMPTLLKHNSRTVLTTFLTQLIIIGADGLTIYALFQGLGTPVSPLAVLIAMTSTRIISIIPFLPGALVLYESSMSFFFVSLGVPLGSAIIVTLVYRLLSFWFPIPAGLLLYRKWLSDSPKETHRE